MVIFISFLEIILPDSNMKRFIDMIVGLLIIVVIITPFIKIFSKDINIEKVFLSNSNKFKNEYIEEDEAILALQQDQVMEAYKKSVKKEIENLIEEKTNYEVRHIDMEIDSELDDEDYGKVKELSLVLKEKEEEKLKDKKSIKVDTIKEIGIIKTKKKNFEDENFEGSDKIKNIISKEYGLSEEKISTHLSRER